MLASLHHKEGLASQKTFEKQTMPEFGNPYFDDCPELLILNHVTVQMIQLLQPFAPLKLLRLHNTSNTARMSYGQDKINHQDKFPSTFQDSKVQEEV